MSPDEMFAEAIRLEEDGQNQPALELWRRLTEEHPTRNAFLRRGRLAKQLGLLEEAESAFQGAVDLDGRCGIAFTFLGMVAKDRGRYEDAVRYLRKACEFGESPGNFSVLGVLLRNLGKGSEAEEAFRTALRIDPNYEEAHFNFGVAQRKTQPAEAEAHFRRALELDPNYACAHRELGYLLWTGDEAEAHLKRAVELDPADGWARIYLGNYLWPDDPEGAESQFWSAHETDAEWSVPFWSLGQLYLFVHRDYEKAQEFFERALALDPEDVVALKGLGRVHQRCGRFEQARECWKRALVLDPEYDGVKKLLAKLGGK